MGYFVSPSGGDITSASASVGSSLSLNGKYVNTGNHSINRVVSQVETLDLQAKVTSSALTSSGSNSAASIAASAANTTNDIMSAVAYTNAELNLDDFYRAISPTSQKVAAYSSAIWYGVVDIYEALLDGIVGIFNQKWAERDYSGEMRDALPQTGVDYSGAYKLGQTLGRIGLCIVVISALTLILGVAAVPTSIVAAACFVVGSIVGIGIAIEKHQTGVRMMLTSILEGLNLASMGVGIAKTAAAMASSTGGFIQNLINKLTGLKDLTLKNLETFKAGKLKFILKNVFDVDLDGLAIGDIDATINFFTKFCKDIGDIITAFYDTGLKGGFKSIGEWLVSKPFSFIDELTGKTKVFSIIGSVFKSFLNGDLSVTGFVNTVVGKFFSILSFVFKQPVAT